MLFSPHCALILSSLLTTLLLSSLCPHPHHFDHFSPDRASLVYCIDLSRGAVIERPAQQLKIVLSRVVQMRQLQVTVEAEQQKLAVVQTTMDLNSTADKHKIAQLTDSLEFQSKMNTQLQSTCYELQNQKTANAEVYKPFPYGVAHGRHIRLEG